jgi:hypothetical protein
MRTEIPGLPGIAGIVAMIGVTGVAITLITGAVFHWLPLIGGVIVGLWAVQAVNN